jgi:glycosyltransferase involved in cell wall biosynthesis
MKIAVYTIAKNEEQFVKKWYNSAKEADYLLIADTGSTDNTIELAKKLGINVVSIAINPWRFDDARNASLALLPTDITYCIQLDMDEVLVEGWRQELEKLNPSVTRPRYKYIWSWNNDGTPGLQYTADKIHARHGYRWKHPAHECLFTDRINNVQAFTNLEIHHHPDNSKSRSSYLSLLEQGAKEDPYSDRSSYYYARELYFYGHYEKAAAEFKKYLSLPTALWKPERSFAMRYISKCEPENKVEWLVKAWQEVPDKREALVDLSQYYYEKGMWKECSEYAQLALDIKEKSLEYLCEADAWSWKPHDLMAISCYYLGRYKEAYENGKMAIEFNKTDERLINNMGFYKKAYNPNNVII